MPQPNRQPSETSDPWEQAAQSYRDARQVANAPSSEDPWEQAARDHQNGGNVWAATQPQQGYQYIQMPDGSYGKFRADASDATIRQAIQKDFPNAYGQPQGQAPIPLMQRMLGDHPISNTLSTVGQHLTNLVSGPFHALADDPQNQREQSVVDAGGGGVFGRFVGLPLDRLLGTSASVENAQNARQQWSQGRHNDAVQSAEDAVPIVGPWARQIENDTREKGALSGLAGLATDVLAPKAAGKIANVIRSAAPGVAEGALGISKVDRAYGKTPGRAILDDTRGFRPAKIADSAGSKLSQLNAEADQMASSHIRPVDMTPARDYIDRAIDKAKSQNNAAGVRSLEPVRDQLTANPFELNQPFASPTVGNPNAVISPFQSAEGAMSLKRGLRNQFVKNAWNPDAGPMLAKDVARGASGVIGGQLEHALGPEFAKTNQRISSLIPVQDAAESMTRGAGIAQRVGGRLRAHTGALTGAGLGAAGGSALGPVGAAAGGIAGLVAPELLGSPTAQMMLARTLHSRIPLVALPAAASGGVFTPRSKREGNQ